MYDRRNMARDQTSPSTPAGAPPPTGVGRQGVSTRVHIKVPEVVRLESLDARPSRGKLRVSLTHQGPTHDPESCNSGRAGCLTAYESMTFVQITMAMIR